MNHQEQKMIREAGTPALLCFKPEEQPTGCRITSFINMKNLGAGNTCIFFHNYLKTLCFQVPKNPSGFFRTYFSQYALEGKHPSSMCIVHIYYLNLSLKVSEERTIQGALTSMPASTVFSAKPRHGSAWHPSLNHILSLYKKILVKIRFSICQNFQNYRSRISEQNSCLIGSIISELGKLVFAVGLLKRG